jgi:hypothetical protein
MDRPRANRKPSFRTQATLIVLPVLVLASVGAWSLRQDRLLAEQEARDRARQLAEMLLPELTEALVRLHTRAVTSAEGQAGTRPNVPEVVSFRVSSDGRLIEPEPLADPVPAPLDPTRLEPALARLWESARNAHFRDRAAGAALTAYHQLLAGNPPDDFAAVAELGVAAIEAQKGRRPQARDRLLFVIDRYPETRLELKDCPVIIVNVHSFEMPAMLEALLATRRLDQDAAHGLGGGPQEMGATRPS